MDERATFAQSKKLEAKADLKGKGEGRERTWMGVAHSRSLGEGEVTGLWPGLLVQGKRYIHKVKLLVQPLNSRF